MKIINNDFYTNNWQDFVHQWVMKKVDKLVQRYNLPVDVDTIESFRIQTNEVGTHDFVFSYTKDGVERTITITPKNDDVEISISDNSTWVVNGEDTGKNTAGLMGPAGERGIQGIQGDKGPQGLKGKTGVQGPKGKRGETGDKGETGDIGEVGIQGLQGDTGLQGEQGERGVVGPQGERGIQGEQGLRGETGDKGPQGIPGTITGGKGPTGPVGLKGETGDKGLTGSKGPQGVIGETGDKGAQGDTGDQGPQGKQGPEGPQGTIGNKGEKGDTGHHPDVSIGKNEHFYIDNVDTDKPSRGENGKLTGLNKDNYVKQMYNTTGDNQSHCYSCISNSDYRRYWGSISTSVSEIDRTWLVPSRSDIELKGLYYSNVDDKVKCFTNSKSKIQKVENYPQSVGIQGIPYGFNCSELYSIYLNFMGYNDTWVFFNGSPFYLVGDDILNGIDNNDYYKWEFMLANFVKGIARFTDSNGNVRTYQPTGVLYRYSRSSTGSGYRYCPAFRPYKKGPQAQWSTTFTDSDSYYNITIEFIDNDGNPVDFENGALIPAHDSNYMSRLYREHYHEMNV